MALYREIAAAYRSPGRAFRRQLAGGPREDRALFYLMLACGLIFVAQIPRLAREANQGAAAPVEALMAGALLGWLVLAPPGLYLLAALSHMIARMMGGHGSWYAARLALFWSLLSAAPLWLLYGLAAGFAGSGAALTVAGIPALGGFLFIWIGSLAEAELRLEDA